MCPQPDKDVTCKELDDGSLVCKPLEYGALDKPKSKKKQRIVAALQEAQRTAHLSEYDMGVPRITGRYVGKTSVCCINQAGRYLAMWWSSPSFKKTYRYHGLCDLATSKFILVDADTGKTAGTLIVTAEGKKPKIALAWGGDEAGAEKLTRRSKRATLSERAIKELAAVIAKGPKVHPVVKGAIIEEHKPLPPREEKIVHLLKGKAVAKELQAIFRHKASHGVNPKIRPALKPLTRRLYKAFRTDISGPKGDVDDAAHPVTAAMRPRRDRLLYHLQDVLHRHELTLEVGEDKTKETQTLFNWFQQAQYLNNEGSIVPLRRYEHVASYWLGIKPHGKYEYDLAIDVVGFTAEASMPLGKRIAKALEKYKKKLPGEASKKIAEWIEEKITANAGGRVLLGTLTVESKGQPVNWKSDYWVTFFVAGGGLGGGDVEKKYLKATGSTDTHLPWKAEHFSGLLSVMSGQAARDKGGKLEENQLILIDEGSHPTEPSIQLLFDKVDTDLSNQALGLGFGWVFEPGDIDKLPPTPPKTKLHSYTAEYVAEDRFDFRLGSATVTDFGRQRLRMLAAHELAQLRQRSVKVTIDGFADRLGSTGYNDVLSGSRAENTKTALHDCLGGKPAAKIETAGWGERHLALLNQWYDFPDNSPSPEWRRVFVTIHGVASVELRVRDLSSTASKP